MFSMVCVFLQEKFLEVESLAQSHWLVLSFKKQLTRPPTHVGTPLLGPLADPGHFSLLPV